MCEFNSRPSAQSSFSVKRRASATAFGIFKSSLAARGHTLSGRKSQNNDDTNTSSRFLWDPDTNRATLPLIPSTLLPETPRG